MKMDEVSGPTGVGQRMVLSLIMGQSRQALRLAISSTRKQYSWLEAAIQPHPLLESTIDNDDNMECVMIYQRT